ncbi:transposase [Streptomyces malaysiensis]|uniref:transposase n=1 Tax=Streptomyces malaysiensis TaxID=92644 RepID=UPI00384AA556
MVPEASIRHRGGGRSRHGDREVLVAIVLVAASGRIWQQLPSTSFGPSGATAHRRFAEWSKACPGLPDPGLSAPSFSWPACSPSRPRGGTGAARQGHRAHPEPGAGPSPAARPWIVQTCSTPGTARPDRSPRCSGRRARS